MTDAKDTRAYEVRCGFCGKTEVDHDASKPVEHTFIRAFGRRPVEQIVIWSDSSRVGGV